MGIRHYGSGVTTNVPAASSIEERAIAFNYADGIIYTSSDGTDVIALSSNRGVEYNTGTTYTAGDVVSQGDKLWIVTTPPAAGAPLTAVNSTEVLTEETGGIAYKAAYTPGYTQGDMVVESDIAYFCNTTYDPSVDWTTDKAKFTAIGTPEVGGIAWSATAYVIGDTVSENGALYICNVGHTGLAGDVPLGSPGQSNQTSWDQATADEHGGRIYEPLLDYEIGDIVYHAIGAQRALHLKITDSTTDGAGTTPLGTSTDTAWQMFAPERGGVLFSMNKAYIDGDIVADTADDVYIHIGGETTGDEPSATPGSWKKLGSASSNAGTGGQDAAAGLTFNGGNNHIPNPADNNNGSTEEYPDTSGESVGAQWTIFGLGAPYPMTTGAISGTTVNNGDTIQWVSGASGAAGVGTEGWFHQAAPTISAERGGLNWQSAETYVTGDIVTDGLIIYTAKSGSTNKQPVTNADGLGTDDWMTSLSDEIGGKAYLDAIDYTIGDVVVDAGIAYFCNNSHTSDIGGVIADDSPSNGGTSWTPIDSQETGGKEYDSGIVYEAGDIVHYLGDIYVVGTTPPIAGVLPTDPLFSDIPPIAPEVAGREWVTGSNYLVGDMIYDSVGNGTPAPNGKIGSYVCTVNIVASATRPSLDAANFDEHLCDGGTY